MTQYSNRAWEKQKKAFKGHLICIKNHLIKTAPFPRGYFDHFLLRLALIPQNHMTS